MIKEGRVCIKLAGRDAGQKGVIKKVIDNNFVLFLGSRKKERKVNIKHLLPTPKIINVSKETKPEEILKTI